MDEKDPLTEIVIGAAIGHCAVEMIGVVGRVECSRPDIHASSGLEHSTRPTKTALSAKISTEQLCFSRFLCAPVVSLLSSSHENHPH